MKAVFTRERWAQRWDEMIKKVPGDMYMNLEEELAKEMKHINEAIHDSGAVITDEQYKAIQRIKAKEIIEKATAKCKSQMVLAKEIQAGRAQLWYTTELQEIRARHNYLERFEFNCYQLAIFREKYTEQ